MDNSRTIYLETNSHDPYYNLAFEEYILSHRTEGSYLLLWQNDNTIVVGQNQNTEAEINRAFVEANNIHVVRRSTGGGAVYHDLGNLNYSFITDMADASSMTKTRFTQPIVMALCALGLDAVATGRNDILVSGRKVSGTAQRISDNRILHHGTLLFDSDAARIAQALQVDQEKFRSKGIQSVHSRVGNIREFLGTDMTMQEFWGYLKNALTNDGLEQGLLSAEELAEVSELKERKYSTWEWNYGRSPKYDFSNRRRWTGGTLEVCRSVKDGCIINISFYGDFLSSVSLEPLLHSLRGCPCELQAITDTLSQFPLERFFGTITQEEVVATILDL